MSAKILQSGIEPEPVDPSALLSKALYGWADAVMQQLRQAERAALSRLEEYTPTERLLNTREAAIYLKKSRRWLDEATRAGKPPSIQFAPIGGEKRFRKAWLDAYINKNAVGVAEIRL